MKILYVLYFFFLPKVSFAEIEVLFHPYDNTLEKIATQFTKAQSRIDMALYNIDTTEKNPVIKALKSSEVQDRISSGALSVRIIFEGFQSKQSNLKKMSDLEKMGIDVKYLGVGRKMHHKFATIDTLKKPYLITGSANWSLSSRRNFNENILFLEDEKELTKSFQSQFDLLWSQAKEFGREGVYSLKNATELGGLREGLSVSFNTENFNLTEKGFRKKPGETFALTRRIVAAINSSRETIEIATTRIKLRPIYEALKSAVARGVKVRLIVTMGEYQSQERRKTVVMKTCKSLYSKKCSSGQNFATFLSREFDADQGIQVRVKYFDLRPDMYLFKQMHSKYIIIDGKEVLTGSFNWSVSAEYNHFENLIYLSSQVYPLVLDRYAFDFENLWKKNRDKFKKTLLRITSDFKKKKKVACGLPAMTLSFREIDKLSNFYRKVMQNKKHFCF